MILNQDQKKECFWRSFSMFKIFILALKVNYSPKLLRKKAKTNPMAVAIPLQ